MKGFTSLEQSKKLKGILPPESADMYYLNGTKHVLVIPNYETDFFNLQENDIPCWSLNALLDIIPYPILYKHADETWKAQKAVLEDVAEEYPGRTIENIIQNINARISNFEKQQKNRKS